VTTTYDVTVTDFFGATAIASVTVEVNLNASATANPTLITAGGQSQLEVVATGGSPPYSYSWSPAASLDDSMVSNPVATPNATTTYDVVVTDSAGAQAFASAEVSVMAAGITSCFTVQIFAPTAVQGNANCSTGSIVQYRWWSDYLGAGQPPTEVTTTPLSRIFRYESGGTKTMRLEVVDGSGNTVASQQTFTTN
jgi:hypothetical protein